MKIIHNSKLLTVIWGIILFSSMASSYNGCLHYKLENMNLKEKLKEKDGIIDNRDRYIESLKKDLKLSLKNSEECYEDNDYIFKAYVSYWLKYKELEELTKD